MIGLFPMVSAKLAHINRSRTKGEWAESMGVQSNIQIVLPQPIDENDMRLLEPGERVSNYRVTWTATEIVPSDEIEYDSKKYKVHQVNDRTEFYRVVMREKVSNVA